MGNEVDSRILTYRTTRAVKAIYFDGMSASLMGSGTESQMIFLYGNSEDVPSRPGPDHGRGPPGGGHRGGVRNPHHGPPSDRQPYYGPPHEKRAELSNSTEETPRWNPLADEYFRARGLCSWIEQKGLGGVGWGYEGIVRMNAGFEMIWCNFTSPSLQLVSNLNASAPRLRSGQDRSDTRRSPKDISRSQQLPLGGLPDQVLPADEGPHGPGMTDPNEPFRGAASWMWFTAAARRYGSSATGAGRGEARAKVRTCGLFSFYDSKLEGQTIARIEEEKSSLNLTADGAWKGPKFGTARKIALDQLTKRRRQHRTNHVSKKDGIFMIEYVEASLVNSLNETGCSDIDWYLTTQEIVAAYAHSLKELFAILSTPASTEIRSWLESVRVITHWLMLPFFEYPPGPYTNESLPRQFSLYSDTAQASLMRCRSQYGILDGEELSRSEMVISKAVQETLAALCNTIFDVGLEVEIEWLSKFNTAPGTSEETLSKPVIVASTWIQKLEDLSAWLGWAEQWTGCEGCKSGVSRAKLRFHIKFLELIIYHRTSVIYPCGQSADGTGAVMVMMTCFIRDVSIVLRIVYRCPFMLPV